MKGIIGKLRNLDTGSQEDSTQRWSIKHDEMHQR
jgi:hypothetical protein